jgi:putative ABC transport system ATP-binding protein
VVLAALARANEQLGITILTITHNAAIAGMADRVMYLADGRIAKIESNPKRISPEELHW